MYLISSVFLLFLYHISVIYGNSFFTCPVYKVQIASGQCTKFKFTHHEYIVEGSNLSASSECIFFFCFVFMFVFCFLYALDSEQKL